MGPPHLRPGIRQLHGTQLGSQPGREGGWMQLLDAAQIPWYLRWTAHEGMWPDTGPGPSLGQPSLHELAEQCPPKAIDPEL